MCYLRGSFLANEPIGCGLIHFHLLHRRKKKKTNVSIVLFALFLKINNTSTDDNHKYSPPLYSRPCYLRFSRVPHSNGLKSCKKWIRVDNSSTRNVTSPSAFCSLFFFFLFLFISPELFVNTFCLFSQCVLSASNWRPASLLLHLSFVSIYHHTFCVCTTGSSRCTWENTSALNRRHHQDKKWNNK